MDSIRTGAMARLLGVTPQTIRKYARQGQIPHHTTPGGELYFTEQDIKETLGEHPTPEEHTWAYYIRSSSGNKTIKHSQLEQLQQKYPQAEHVIQDNASGLNENRSGLKKLYKLAEKRAITDIAITNKDRLTRFGFTYLERYFNSQGVEIHVLNAKKDATNPASELIDDFMALLASFAGRYYRMRSRENQHKLLDQARTRLEEKDNGSRCMRTEAQE